VGLHALRALRTLRSQGELCDVVLAAGEEQVLAHQAILAAASPKLREHILAQNRCLPGERDDDLCLPPEPLEIRLEHMAPAALKALVDQLYGSQVCQSEIAGGLRQLRSEGLLCDILLKVGKERLPAHQVVLAANCSGLRKMLRAKHTLELELNGVSAEAVRILLDFLYGEDRQVPSELCRDLLHLAKELKLPALQERCFAEPKEVCPQQVLEVSSTQEATQEEPPRVLTMRCLRFSSGPVPSPPKDALEAADAAGEIYCKQDVAFLRGLVRLFWERSVWLEPALTQAPLLAKTMDAQRLKRLLPYVAYQWREGPWQQAYARLGFDPREEPEAMKWQVVMFTDKDLPRGPRGRPTGGHKAAEDIWFAQAPANRCQLYQLECIEDECVQSLMQDVEPQKECQLKTGFLDPVLHDAILERLQVSWEQKRSAATSAFEAEVCFGTAGSDSQDWQPVRSLYLQQMTEDSTEKDAPAGPRLVQASVSLEADYTHLEQAWRLRVRVAGGDWSTPSAWQEPSGTAAELPHPSKPSVRSNVYTYTLEWAVSGGDALVQTLRYEVQVQARKRRGSSKFSDWVAVRSFYSPEEASGNSCAVTAVVERAAAAEAVKVSFGYEELRFRVRALSTQGASAFSEHSETEMLQVAQPAVQGEVPLPDLAGRGYVLLEDEKSKALVQSELLHLCWPKPELKVSELNEGTPQLEYRLETLLGTEDDESDWQANRALIISEPDSSIVTALVPLPEEEDEEDLDVSLTEEETRISLARKLQPVEARFRLCAERPSSDICRFDPVHSAPSATFCWDAPEMPEQVNVVGAAGNMLCVVFHWTSLARCCRGLLWACLELRFGDNEAPEEERPEAEAEAELEMSDVASETQSEIIGGLPVFWQPASELRQLSGAK
ncbi:unnamed protein product, partial [Effrenium voratum]